MGGKYLNIPNTSWLIIDRVAQMPLQTLLWTCCF